MTALQLVTSCRYLKSLAVLLSFLSYQALLGQLLEEIEAQAGEKGGTVGGGRQGGTAEGASHIFGLCSMLCLQNIC